LTELLQSAPPTNDPEELALREACWKAVLRHCPLTVAWHSAGTWRQLERIGLNEMNPLSCFGNQGLRGKPGLGSMGDENGISLSAKIETLIGNYGIKELLSALHAVCWGKAAKATEDRADPSQWSELAVKLGAVIEI
jgi:hypothetical protein